MDSLDLTALDGLFDSCSLSFLCDVNHPFLGPQGAAHVFGPQKYASPPSSSDIDDLESQMKRWKTILNTAYFNHSLVNPSRPGFGAAGGLAFGLARVTSVNLESGIEAILNLLNFDHQISDADWVITGEGRLDQQSQGGKVVWGVLKRARKAQKKVICVVGDLEGSAPKGMEVYTIRSRTQTLDEAIQNAAYYLEEIGKEIAQEIA